MIEEFLLAAVVICFALAAFSAGRFFLHDAQAEEWRRIGREWRRIRDAWEEIESR